VIVHRENPPTPWLRWGIWLGLALLMLALVGPLFRFVDTSRTWLDYPYPRPGSEGLILYETLLVKRGGDIYAPITPERFISGPYPPVFYWLAAWTLPNVLPNLESPGNVESVFCPGRMLALAATLLAAALVALLVVYEGGYPARGRRAVALAAIGGVIGGTLLLTLPQVLVWATRFRGDMLMIALTAAGLACISAGARSGQPHTRWLSPMLLLGAALFSLAFFTKQTALAGPIAAGSYLLLRDWRSGLKWCALMFAFVAVPFALLDLATGHWFYLKMVVYHSLPFSSLTLTRLLHFSFWDEEWPLLLAAAGYSLYMLSRLPGALRTRTTWELPLLIPLFLLASLLTLPTGGVVGADHNHLLMPGLAICAASGALLAKMLGDADRTTGDRRPTTDDGSLPTSIVHRPSSIVRLLSLSSLVALALLLGYVVFTSPPSAVGYGPDLAVPSPQEREQLRKITLNVRTTPGDVFFSDDPGILALAGKATLYDDPFTMAALATQGRWDEAAFRDMLRQGKFPLLVLSCDVPGTISGQQGIAKPCRHDTFTPGVLDAINDGYEVIFRDVFFTYAPKGQR
jgi:hypothetical protein